jgi:hypothetical protein
MGERGAKWQIVPPLGPHLLAVVASRTPLLTAKRPDVEDSAGYMRYMEAALTKAETGADVASHYILIDFRTRN